MHDSICAPHTEAMCGILRHRAHHFTFCKRWRIGLAIAATLCASIAAPADASHANHGTGLAQA